MTFPDFFAAAPSIRVRDPLADFLGAADQGIFEYRYEDAVRLAGHSCPTVATAFLLTRNALVALYPNELPVRGEIQVSLAESPDTGVAGVIASIATLITGATVDTGFRGLGGQFNRRHSLFFAQQQPAGSLRFKRRDSGCTVTVSANLSLVPGDPRISELLPRCLNHQASPAEITEFGRLWQDRVWRILERADDAQVFFCIN